MQILELIAYLAGFWLFLFSAEFRRKQIAEFHEAGPVGRFFICVQGAVATLCGIAPFWVLHQVILA